MQTKKGQAAMEFLLTYGWAIVIIVVALAALFFLGVFSSGSGTANCNAQGPIHCKQAVITNEAVLLNLAVANVQTAKVVEVTINGEECHEISNVDLSTTSDTLVRCTGLNLDENEKVKVGYVVSYRQSGGITEQVEGDAAGKAKLTSSNLYNTDQKLVAGYDFESDLGDVSGNNFKVENVGGVDCTAEGKVGNGCYIDANSYLRIPHNSKLNLNPDFSISFWFKMEGWVPYTTTSPRAGTIIEKFTSGIGADFPYYIGFRTENDPDSGNQNSVHFGRKDSTGDIYLDTGGDSIERDKWNYIVAIRDTSADELRIYLNGELKETKTDPTSDIAINDEPVYIGYRDNIGTADVAKLIGTIDELAIHNRVLTDEEIKAHYDKAV